MNPTRWKIASAGVAAAALGAVGVLPACGDDDDGPGGEGVELEDQTSTTEVDASETTDAAADDAPSPDGESADSPNQSPDDSAPGEDSVDTPGESPNETVDVDTPDNTP
ncbi:MAG: hypothetical protein ACRD07_04010 [Acidimicrobiales bacterium]